MKKRLISALVSSLFIVTMFSGCSFDSSIFGKDVTSSSIEYEDKIFDNSYVHKINIKISEDDLKDLQENPKDKTKYQVDVTIDGETCKDVSFNTKGNTSLSQVADNDDSDRYSYKINFGKFIDNQNFYGLDKLSLNNIISDATYMKDYLSYKIIRESGAPSPLASYVLLSINGEEKGLYLAVEDIDDSFVKRNYGEDADGELYKPETEALNNMDKDKQNRPDMNGDKGPNGDGEGPNGDGENMAPPDMNGEEGPNGDGENMTPPDMNGGEDPNGDGENMTPPDMNGGEGPNGDGENMAPQDMKDANMPSMNQNHGTFGGSSSGAALSYTDDNIESYSDIFDNAETKIDDNDKERLISSLKKLNSDNDNLEDCLEIDEVIKYFVGHNFTCNYDSYTGNMLHNYFLYEDNGIMSVFPWDYNLAFGGFGGQMMKNDNKEANTDQDKTKNSSLEASMVNYAIDTPLSGASEDDRPLWKAIIQNDEYKELYHKYFDELISGYFESGDFEKEIDDTYNMIRPYVEDDVSAFYSVSEFDKGYETLKKFCLLRSESIRKQLNGTIPSTTDEQREDEASLVNADDIEIQDMGSQGGAKGGQNGEDKKGFQKRDMRNNNNQKENN